MFTASAPASTSDPVHFTTPPVKSASAPAYSATSPADWNAQLEQGYHDCLQKHPNQHKEKHYPYYAFGKPHAYNYERRVHESSMDRMMEQFHNARWQNERDEVMFRTWRQQKMTQIFNEQLKEREKWASEDREKRASLRRKFDDVCRQLKDKELDKFEAMWKKS
jgi:hypothetical protein